MKEFRHYGTGEDGNAAYSVVCGMLAPLAKLFSRNHDVYFVTTTVNIFPPSEKVGGDVNSEAKPCIPHDPAAQVRAIFPATEAGFLDSIDSRESFFCNANSNPAMAHNDYADARGVEVELCERRRKCKPECIAGSRLNPLPDYNGSSTGEVPCGCKRRTSLVGKSCTCGAMYIPSKCGDGSGDNDHDACAKAEILCKRKQFPHQFVVAHFNWDGTTPNGKDINTIDRMGEYSGLWEGSDLNSHDTLPTNTQQFLVPNVVPDDTSNTTTNSQQDAIVEPDPEDIEVDKLDSCGHGGAAKGAYLVPPTEGQVKLEADDEDAPSLHKSTGSRTMYADSIAAATPTRPRPTSAPMLRPNFETWASNFDRLLEKDIAKKGYEVHTKWGGPRGGDDNDDTLLPLDPWRSAPLGQEHPERPTRHTPKTRGVNVIHGLIAPMTGSASNAPWPSPQTGSDHSGTAYSRKPSNRGQPITMGPSAALLDRSRSRATPQGPKLQDGTAAAATANLPLQGTHNTTNRKGSPNRARRSGSPHRID